MDALGLDVMHEEYQEQQQAAAEEVRDHRASGRPEPSGTSRGSSEPPSSEGGYESGLGSSETVPVSDVDEVDLPQAAADSAEKGGRGQNRDSVSSAGSAQEDNTSQGSSSFYSPASMSPQINYERDFAGQRLVAVIGRQFDEPNEVATNLQRLLPQRTATSGQAVMKFVPFTMKRRALLKGSFSSEELSKHDLICMCYNASEARILLTGPDGFYSTLLKITEAILGSNKVAFLISNYNWPLEEQALIAPALQTRLHNQEPLRTYLDRGQVLSWLDRPNEAQVDKLGELTELPRNPQNTLNQSCSLL